METISRGVRTLWEFFRCHELDSILNHANFPKAKLATFVLPTGDCCFCFTKRSQALPGSIFSCAGEAGGGEGKKKEATGDWRLSHPTQTQSSKKETRCRGIYIRQTYEPDISTRPNLEYKNSKLV